MMSVPLPLSLRTLLRWARSWKGPEIPLFQRVVIELQSHCNRDCYFCCRESDISGKRKSADGKSVQQSMPTDKVMALFDELESLGFKGYITFHHLSEAFLDKRLMQIGREARRRGMKPYVHTNGDVLRANEQLCKHAAEVFEYVVVGLYDYSTEAERDSEKKFWRKRLRGIQVMFSLAENVYARTHSPVNARMTPVPRQVYPTAVCAQPQKYLMIHYNGDVACCCEDMYGELLKFNIFETSIQEIWYSERHAQIVDALLAGDRGNYDLCARCTMGPNRYARNPMDETRHYDT